jgi:MFS family permease
VWAPARRRLTLGLALTITLVAFESLAISTVMPVVADDLGGLGLYGWVFSGFFLGNLLGIVTAGQSADARGTAFPFAVGLALFTVGLLVGGLAPTMPVLVAARVVQGIGAGAIPAVAYTTVGRMYPPALRPRLFAVFSSAWIIPGLIGPAASGAIEHAATWRAVFLALLPFVALAAAMTLPVLSHTVGNGTARADPGADPVSSAGLDSAGGSVLGGVSAGVVGFAVEGSDGAGGGGDRGRAGEGRGGGADVAPGGPPTDRRRDGLILTLGAASVLVAVSGPPVGLAVVLLVVGAPVAARAFLRLVPPGTMRLAPGVPAAVLVRGILTFAFFGTDAYVSLTFQEVRDRPTWVAGAALTAATIAWTAAAWVQERLVHRVGPRRLVTIGFGLLAVGIVGMQGALGPLPVPVAIAVWALAGGGVGLSYSPLSVTVLGLAEPGREGAASSSLQLSDVLGVALGAGTGGALVALSEAQGWALRSALEITFAITMAVAIGGIAAARRLPTTLPG